jgi:competence protein ComEA
MTYIRSTVMLFSLLLAVATQVFSSPVDINTANAETLASSIDGVGERKARAIVEYREANGPFANVEDLANVKGIGLKTVDNNRNNLTAVTPAH